MKTEVALAIAGARLIDGIADGPISSANVLIGKNGRFIAIGPPQIVPIPKGVRTLDAAGRTLLPGLIDGHQHLMWDKSLYEPRAVGEQMGGLQDAERQLVRAGYYAQTALAAGVTTLRDCGADDFSVLALRDMIDAGNFVGPRVLTAGRFITTTAGHTYTDWGVDTRDEIKKAVRHLASRGVDFIKILVSGGTTTPGTNISASQYTLEELQTAVDDAHRLGLQVAAHAISTHSIQLCAAAGVDTIEHCSWIGSDPRTCDPDPEAVAQMVRNDVRVDHAIIPRPYNFPDETETPPTPEEKWWLSMLQVRWPFLRYMREQGVTVFLGTDAAYGSWRAGPPWPGFQDLARAMEILTREAEFTPMEVIQMVTREAARALRLDGEIGTVEAGKRADFILLVGDPLDDIRTLRNVDMVFRDGVLVAQGEQVRLTPAGSGERALRGWELPM